MIIKMLSDAINSPCDATPILHSSVEDSHRTISFCMSNESNEQDVTSLQSLLLKVKSFTLIVLQLSDRALSLEVIRHIAAVLGESPHITYERVSHIRDPAKR